MLIYKYTYKGKGREGGRKHVSVQLWKTDNYESGEGDKKINF